MRKTLESKIQNDTIRLDSLKRKRDNLDREISNLEKKIQNRIFQLNHLKDDIGE